jgi:hypothetical protein
MASERPEAAYAARLLERQDALDSSGPSSRRSRAWR